MKSALKCKMCGGATKLKVGKPRMKAGGTNKKLGKAQDGKSVTPDTYSTNYTNLLGRNVNKVYNPSAGTISKTVSNRTGQPVKMQVKDVDPNKVQRRMKRVMKLDNSGMADESYGSIARNGGTKKMTKGGSSKKKTGFKKR
jgi:hypothetical protein